MRIIESRTLAACATSARPARPASALAHDAPGVRVVVFRIEPGEQVLPHTSPSTVVLSIVEGDGSVSGEGGEREVRAGDVVVYEPGERHGMRASEHRMIIVAAIAPRPAMV